MKKGKIFIRRVMVWILAFALVLSVAPTTVIATGQTAGDSTVSFLNSGYPYGKNIDRSKITLVIEAEGTSHSYQWQVAESETGTFSDISGANTGTYTFSPTNGYWYRCVVDGTASKAVMAVYPGRDGRTWTGSRYTWYISNGYMAYMVDSGGFDVTGLYRKNNTDYMLQTSFSTYWNVYSSTDATPDAIYYGSATTAVLDTLRVAFDERDDYQIIFEADLGEGHQAFAFGCDTQLGDYSTSGGYSDSAALNAMMKNGKLQQIAMIGSATVEGAADTDPAFVIAPVTPVSGFWIGHYSSRECFGYNTNTSGWGVKTTENIGGQNVVTLLEGDDSGMTMSWMNVSSGGTVKFMFSVGSVADTGAVSGKVNYEEEKLTGLDPNTTYVITYDDKQFTIESDDNGDIPLSGSDKDGNPYDFVGKKIKIAKQGSDDTPAEVEVSDRPETPDNPSDLGDGENNTPEVDANIEIVELTTTSVTIAPKTGQQYAYSVNGTDWTTLNGTNGNGNYVISGLQEGSIVYVRTRISASNDAPASQWSEATRIKLKSTVTASVSGWSGTYNKEVHSISVTVTSPVEGATIAYTDSANGSYSETNPKFSEAGEYTVYYRVTADGYYPAYGSAIVRINPKEVVLDWDNTELIYNGKLQMPVATVNPESLCPGDTCNVTVTGGQRDYSSSPYVARAIALNNSNYRLPVSATKEFTIDRVELTISINDAVKHIGKADPEFTYNITEGNLVEGEDLDDIVIEREEGETVGDYEISAVDEYGYYSNYDISVVKGKLTIEDGTVVDKAVPASCTDSGLTEGSHCPLCGEVFDAQDKIPALGHDWSGEWKVIYEATDTSDGKKEITCSREGCNHKKFEVIPATGTEEENENPNAGNIQKDAEVSPDAPIESATLNNKTSELIGASDIFTEEEKTQINNGLEARVWIVISNTDVDSIPADDKASMEELAEKIIGEKTDIVYFDASLFKQVEGGEKTSLSEPGIPIKVTVQIPDELLNKDKTIIREYLIIRYHIDEATGKSRVDVLDGTFNEATGDLSFETDRFSTYAIVYNDIHLVTGVIMTPDGVTLTSKGATAQLTATVTPDNAAEKTLKWSSSDTSVATADENGRVTAVANGTCTITVKTVDGGKTASSIITVKIPAKAEDSPSTGDTGNPIFWLMLLILSGCMGFLLRKDRRKCQVHDR